MVMLPLFRESGAAGTSVPLETQRRMLPPTIHSELRGTHALPHSGGGASFAKMIRRGKEQPAVLLMTRYLALPRRSKAVDQTPLFDELIRMSCRLSGKPRTRDAGKLSEPLLPPHTLQNLFFLQRSSSDQRRQKEIKRGDNQF